MWQLTMPALTKLPKSKQNANRAAYWAAKRVIGLQSSPFFSDFCWNFMKVILALSSGFTNLHIPRLNSKRIIQSNLNGWDPGGPQDGKNCRVTGSSCMGKFLMKHSWLRAVFMHPKMNVDCGAETNDTI